MLVQGLTTNGHHKSFFCYLFYVAIYMRYLKSIVRPLVLFFEKYVSQDCSAADTDTETVSVAH